MSEEQNENSEAATGAPAPAGRLTPYLSPAGVWALAFGCSVGWGAFVMPGTTFLPIAGPAGSALGLGLGAVVMLIIGMNYHFLMNRYPDSGGTFTYAKRAFGYDHGFLSAWFLLLVYVAIVWANATALPLIARNLYGPILQFGFHYVVAGYDVYLGEALLSLCAIVLFGLVCMFRKKLAGGLQTALAVILFAGILVCFGAALANGGGRASFTPAFAPTDVNPALQILSIVALAPWAYVGFESVSHSTAEFTFSPKRTIWLIVAALVTGALSYILLSELAVAILPDGFGSWTGYISQLGNLDGLEGLPTFYAAHEALGTVGLAVLGITLLAAIITGLVGNCIAASRLIYSLASDGLLPEWFGRTGSDGTPRNAILFIILISLIIPFFGRTAIGWIVDVTTIGASIAYGYTSAAALHDAREERNVAVMVTGTAGLAISVIFFLYFMVPSIWSVGALSPESYLILAVWGLLGFIFFRSLFKRDQMRMLGRTTVVWNALLCLVFLTTLMWSRQATNVATETAVENIGVYYASEMENLGVTRDEANVAETEQYAESKLGSVTDTLVVNSIVQMALVALALIIMFRVYSVISHRERAAEEAKLQAEESNKAKSTFLSNMSHDIRTPMNAIIGYTTLAQKETDVPPSVERYLRKIDTSSKQLLALINDVLDMSRYESGKMELELSKVNLPELLENVKASFADRCSERGISIVLSTSQVKHPHVYCDRARLERVLDSLVDNAVKFSYEGGDVTITLWEIDAEEEGTARFDLHVRDTGRGMAPEFAAKVFEAFERERTSTASGLQGTGLGMAIVKNIVDLMGGTITVDSAPERGTEFVIRVNLALQSEEDIAQAQAEREAREAREREAEQAQDELDFAELTLLLVEDNPINREIATMVLEEVGFTLEEAENGQEAVDAVAAADPGHFDAVLMDIQMPVLNGYEATAAIRELPDTERAAVPIIAMTANSFAEDVQTALDAGMDGHIAKPIDLGAVLDTLTSVLSRRR